jgi:ATP-dependent Clp protease ATP-binding subunit ClpA
MNDRDRFDKFTERARKVLSLAQEEAQRFNHNYIGTEHLLLGLVREGDGVAARVLSNLGVELQGVRSTVEAMIGRGDRLVLGEIGLTPRAKKAIELAVDEARRLNHHYIGTEHVLLGLVREEEGIAAKVLNSLGVNLERVRTQTIQVLSRTSATHERAEAQPLGSQRHWVMQRAAASMSAYQPHHIQAETTERTAIGAAGRQVMLGWVVVNTGGQFTLTLYHGAEPEAPKVAVIANPPTGASFPFHCLLEHGLTYTLEGTPGSVTIMCGELPA